jgi:hypothetical protein
MKHLTRVGNLCEGTVVDGLDVVHGWLLWAKKWLGKKIRHKSAFNIFALPYSFPLSIETFKPNRARHDVGPED